MGSLTVWTYRRVALGPQEAVNDWADAVAHGGVAGVCMTRELAMRGAALELADFTGFIGRREDLDGLVAGLDWIEREPIEADDPVSMITAMWDGGRELPEMLLIVERHAVES